MTNGIKITCRGCGENIRSEPIIDLGRLPLANSNLSKADLLKDNKESRERLALFYCSACSLVQIDENISPVRLFDEYQYFSSNSDQMVEHARALTERLVKECKLSSASFVFEIASNDGYLLQHYKHMGIPVLGIEPAGNVAEVAWLDKGIPTLIRYFTSNLGAHFKEKCWQADVIHAHNVFAHVPNPTDFMQGICDALKPGGLCIIEVPYIVDLVEKLEFDTIYHEHFSYFSLTSVMDICRKVGMAVIKVERVWIHGGSIRFFIAHLGSKPVDASVPERLIDEKRLGVDTFNFYADFESRVLRLKNDLTSLLANIKAEGKSIAAYGASAKGSTLMNAFGIGKNQIDFVVDRSQIKQGRFTPGNHIEILPPEEINLKNPDYVLLLTWNFADEILEQQAVYRQNGGKFIIPLPQIKIL